MYNNINEVLIKLNVKNNDFTKKINYIETNIVCGYFKYIKYKEFYICQKIKDLNWEILNSIEFYNILKKEYQEIINNKFKKNNYIKNKLKKTLEEQYEKSKIKNCEDQIMQIQKLISVYNLYKINKKYFKNKNILDNYKGIDNIENLYNEIISIIENEKLNIYIKKMFSNKYKHLITEKTKSVFNLIIKEKIDEKIIKNFIISNIAIYENSDDFTNDLSKILLKESKWNKKNILNFIKNQKLEFTEDNNILKIKIEKYETIKQIDVIKWCINRSEDFFYSYVTNTNKFYLMIDYNRNIYDDMFITGISLSIDNKIMCAYDQYNKDVTYLSVELFSKYFILDKNIHLKIIKEYENKNIKFYEFINYIRKYALDNKIKNFLINFNNENDKMNYLMYTLKNKDIFNNEVKKYKINNIKEFLSEMINRGVDKSLILTFLYENNDEFYSNKIKNSENIKDTFFEIMTEIIF